jgi:hypothetical protein
MAENLRPLSTGDQVPDITIDSIHNFRNSSTRLSGLLKNSNLIIIFWGLRYGECIRLLPRLMEMQKANKTNLQWLLVSDEPDSIVQVFFKKYLALTKLKITVPVVHSSEALQQLFPHLYAPHCVWIDHERSVRYVTDLEPLNMENVTAFAGNNNVSLPAKDEKELEFFPLKPLFINGYAGNGENLARYSVFSHYIKGMLWIAGITGDSSKSIGLIFNYPVKAMYQLAYNDLPNNSYTLPDNRTILQVSDTTKYVYIVNNKLRLSNLWCYQLITPPLPDSSIKQTMRKELDNFFGLNSHMEKRKMTCWVLHAADTSLLRSAGGKIVDRSDFANFRIIMQNRDINELSLRFTSHILRASPFPFVNETNFKGKIDLVLEDIVDNDIDSIQKALAKYKLHLQLEERKIDMLVIKEDQSVTRSW